MDARTKARLQTVHAPSIYYSSTIVVSLSDESSPLYTTGVKKMRGSSISAVCLSLICFPGGMHSVWFRRRTGDPPTGAVSGVCGKQINAK